MFFFLFLCCILCACKNCKNPKTNKIQKKKEHFLPVGMRFPTTIHQKMLIFVWDFSHTKSASTIFIYLFIYLYTRVKSRHVVSSWDVSKREDWVPVYCVYAAAMLDLRISNFFGLYFWFTR